MNYLTRRLVVDGFGDADRKIRCRFHQAEEDPEFTTVEVAKAIVEVKLKGVDEYVRLLKDPRTEFFLEKPTGWSTQERQEWLLLEEYAPAGRCARERAEFLDQTRQMIEERSPGAWVMVESDPSVSFPSTQ